jgi:hypothetical protein
MFTPTEIRGKRVSFHYWVVITLLATYQQQLSSNLAFYTHLRYGLEVLEVSAVMKRRRRWSGSPWGRPGGGRGLAGAVGLGGGGFGGVRVAGVQVEVVVEVGLGGGDLLVLVL